MKGTLITTAIVILTAFLTLNYTFKGMQYDMAISVIGLSSEKNQDEFMARMEKAKRGTNARIFSALAIPVANYAVYKSGGVLPLWGSLGQSIFWALLTVPWLIRILPWCRNKKASTDEIG